MKWLKCLDFFGIRETTLTLSINEFGTHLFLKKLKTISHVVDLFNFDRWNSFFFGVCGLLEWYLCDFYVCCSIGRLLIRVEAGWSPLLFQKNSGYHYWGEYLCSVWIQRSCSVVNQQSLNSLAYCQNVCLFDQAMREHSMLNFLLRLLVGQSVKWYCLRS